MKYFQRLVQYNNIKIRVLLALSSVFLLFISMPGGSFPLLTWVSLVPIGLAITNASTKLSGILFYLAAVGWHLLTISMLAPGFMKFTQLNLTFNYVILFIFCLILALPYAIIGGLISYKNWINKPFGIFFISSTYTVILAYFPTILPANHAHSLYQHPIFLQLAEVGGVSAILFIVVFVNWQFVQAIYLFRSSLKSSFYAVLKGLTVLLLVSLYGVWRINYYAEVLQKETTSITVGMIQPNLKRESSLDSLYTMSARLVAKHPSIDLLVWPEFPTLFSYVENKLDKRKVNQLISLTKKPMLIVSGYLYKNQPSSENPNPQYYNTAQLIDQNGDLTGIYKKQILVPFFEYLPGEKYFPFLRKLFPGTLRYVPGSEPAPLPFTTKVKIIPLICYETIFPDITRALIDKGGNIIINMTNDIWFGDSWGSSYHFALGIFRSIEHRVPWIRVTNSGVSGVAKTTGEIIEGSTTPLFKKETRVIKVTIPSKRSFYSIHGDLILHLVVTLLLFNLLSPKITMLFKKRYTTGIKGNSLR